MPRGGTKYKMGRPLYVVEFCTWGPAENGGKDRIASLFLQKVAQSKGKDRGRLEKTA